MYRGEITMARNKNPEETLKLIVDEALKLFVEKGYDNTSIQDIIDRLGGLSKGAIYHHFKSKEEIFEAVGKKIGNENAAWFIKIRDDDTMTGYEKLKMILKSATSNPNQEAIFSMTSGMMNDPKFLALQIAEIFELVAPKYIQPIIEQGIKDGSIKTEYPKEMAEVIIVLTNIWLNPMIIDITPEEMASKCHFFNKLLQGIGLDLLDETMINQYTQYCKMYHNKK